MVRRVADVARRVLPGEDPAVAPDGSTAGPDPTADPGPPDPPAVLAWPVPQLPGRASAGAIIAHPNRLPASVLPRTVHLGDAGPWRDLDSPVRAAHAAAARLLGVGTAPPAAVPTGRDPLAGTEPGADGGRIEVDDEDARGWAEWRHPHLVERLAVAGDRPRRAVPAGSQDPGDPLDGRSLVVVGYDMKFVAPMLAELQRRGTDVSLVTWERFRSGDEDATTAAIAAADVVLAEWCGPNAALASRVVRDDQRLVVRLHRFELEQPDWREVAIERVDAVVTVSEHYRRRTQEVTGWPAERVVVVPNAVDVDHHDRPKLPSARWTIGLLGADRSRKRLDRALDVLERLRSHDERWQLRIKGVSPWDSPWVAGRPDEVAWFATQLRRLDEEPLRSGVVLDPHGPDVATWLRGIGYVLSPSIDESFHLSPAEGAASGAVPVLWPWPGAGEVHDPSFVVADAAEAATRLHALASDDAVRAEAAATARARVGRYRLGDVTTQLGEVLAGPSPSRGDG